MIESTKEVVQRVLKESWQKSKYKSDSGGLTQAGVDKYKSENPGSKLKTAVTKKPCEMDSDSKGRQAS